MHSDFELSAESDNWEAQILPPLAPRTHRRHVNFSFRRLKQCTRVHCFLMHSIVFSAKRSPLLFPVDLHGHSTITSLNYDVSNVGNGKFSRRWRKRNCRIQTNNNHDTDSILYGSDITCLQKHCSCQNWIYKASTFPRTFKFLNNAGRSCNKTVADVVIIVIRLTCLS